MEQVKKAEVSLEQTQKNGARPLLHDDERKQILFEIEGEMGWIVPVLNHPPDVPALVRLILGHRTPFHPIRRPPFWRNEAFACLKW